MGKEELCVEILQCVAGSIVFCFFAGIGAPGPAFAEDEGH